MKDDLRKDRKCSTSRHRNVLGKDVERNLWLLFHVQIMIEGDTEIRRQFAKRELKKNCSEEEIKRLVADFRGIGDLDKYMDRIKQIVSHRLKLN